MKKIGIFYGSTTGNTEAVANKLQEVFGNDNTDLFDASNASKSDIENYSNLIFGCSTWGIGDLQDDFEEFISVIEAADLVGKKVAIFGTGDQCAYSDSFVDSIGTIYETVKNKNCDIIGSFPTDDFTHSESKAEVNGVFVGLPIDEDNDSDKTDERIDAWTKNLKEKFM
jgi:flavodoxin I